MIRKTYGVSGLMDWTTQIKAGKVSVSVHFTGGALTAYGVTPAKYSTSNPFFQSVIENSEQYKNGRIKLLGEMEVADDAAAKARKARKAAKASEKPTTKEVQPTGQEALEAEAEIAPQSKDESNEESASEQADSAVADNMVKVADKSDAIEYLKENFPEKGYTAVKLRTKSAFEAACKECGVEFDYTV